MVELKTKKKVPVKLEKIEFVPEVLQPGIIYLSEKFETAVHLCLCGCGNKSVTPLGNEWWKVTENEKGVTFTPSILNMNCPNESHYIITNGIANVV